MTDAGNRHFVSERAVQRCEYCRLHQEHSQLPHHVEHIVARQHGGSDALENLALACHRCNLNEGPNLAGVDPVTDEVVPLFHPRRDRWSDHFRIEGARIEGRTAIGRATIRVLKMNDPRRLELREEILKRRPIS